MVLADMQLSQYSLVNLLKVYMTSITIYGILESKPHNPHYLKRYLKFVLSYSSVIKVSNQNLENHHILPKSKGMFPEYSSFSKNPWNKVVLPIRAHIIAHYLLMKAYPQSFGMAKAVERTSHQVIKSGCIKYCSRLIESARKESLIRRRKLTNYYNPSTMERAMLLECPDGWLQGFGPRTEEQNRNNSNAQLGVNKDVKFWNNGTEHKRSKECPGDGWVLGLLEAEKQRRTECVNQIGNRWWNNGIENRKCVEKPGEEWVFGKFYKPASEKQLAQCRTCASGTVWWNNPNTKEEKKLKESPGPDWIRGRSSKLKMDQSKGMSRWNNGITNTSAYECPGEGWVRGMIRKKN